MKREYFRTAFFAVSVLVLTCIFGETGARLLHRAPAPLITLDACVGYKGISSAQGYAGGPAGLVPISINSSGFRDVEHTQQKSAAAYRILFLGDSFTEAIQVPLQDTFWRTIQAKAGAAHLPLEVISVSVSSWSTGQEVLAYECYGRTYHPDLVVLDFNTDDILDNAVRQDMFTPTFTLKNGTLALDEIYKKNIAQRLAARATLYPGALYYLKDHSELLRYLLFLHANNAAGTTITNAEHTPSVTDAAWSLTDALFARLAADVHADNAQLLLVNFPTLRNISIEPLKIFARTHDLPLVDVTSALDAANSTGALHWPADPHLTQLGHAVVAQLLFDTITKNYLSSIR